MKKRIPTRVLSAFLAVLMAFLVIPISTLTVSATETKATKPMTPLQKYRAETTDSLEKITSYIDKREAADEKLANSFGTKIGKINKVAGSIGKVANAALAVYNSIDPDNKWYENVANVALSLVTSYLGIQLPGQETSDAEIILTEVQNMINDLEQRLGEEFDAVNANIDELSKKVDANSVDLAAYVSQYIDKQEYKDALNSFTGEFNYYNYKKELATAYEALITTINSGATEENIKKAYDNLYSIAKKSEVSKDGSAGLYDYMMGSNRTLTDGYSIQEILYNYAVMTENSGRPDLEIECIEFAEDLYDTYVFSQYALILCYNYQLGYLYSYTENPISEHYSFYSQVQENDVACSVILSNMEDLVIDLDNINEEMARYVCYVSNLDGSFIYESGALNDHSLYKVPYKEVFSVNDFETQPFNTKTETISYSDVGDKNYYIRTNNKVSAGDTLYLNVMPELFASLFTIGNFYFEVDNGSLATVNKAGVVNVLDNASAGTFTVTMYYNDNSNPMYSMTFEVVSRVYAGGLGTEKAPFLISEWSHIAGKNGLANNKDYYDIEGIYFALTNDINAQGALFNGIPSLKGVFDGNGYSIHSFSINDTSQKAEKNVGFFYTNEGAIINLTIGDEDVSIVNDYSVSIVSKATETSAQNHHSIGTITGKNSGYIYNCFVENVSVVGDLYDNNNNEHAFCNAGGIAGINMGTITRCSVEDSKIVSYLSAAKDSGDNNYATAGGIVGKNEGEVNLSVSHTNKLIRADARGDGKNDDNMAYPEAFVGGLIGDSRNGSADDSVTYNNTLEVYGSEGGNTSPTMLKGLYVGVTKNTYLACKGTDSESFYTNCSGNTVTGYSFNENNDLNIPAATLKKVFVWYLIASYDNDTGECVSVTDELQFASYLTDDCWYFDSGYPTLRPVFTMTRNPETSVGGLSIENITEYYQGETNFKYITYAAGVAPEYRNETTHTCSLSSHRIDTSNIGVTKAVILSEYNNSDLYDLYNKEEIKINVIKAEIAEIYIYTMPVKTEYLIGDKADTAGLKLFAKYNNGFCNPILLEDCTLQYDFSNQGNTNVNIIYNEKYSTVYNVTVTCGHKNTSIMGEQSSTCNNIGYTAGTYCNDCETYISGHEEIPVLSSHPYGEWTNFSETQHVRTCACGEVEYANHAWNDGVVTTEPTHLASGEKTYTCTECTATKTEELPPIAGHTFGEWTEHDDTQHVRSCQCGETEYADHTWDDGTITTPATYEKEGERTYTCLDCEATFTVAIPKPVSVHLFVVDDASAVPGGTMQVNVRLENNPGIAMMRLKVSYDSSVLTLNQVTYNTEIGGTATQPTISDGYVTLLWYNESENVEGDWIFATLTFTVKDTAPVGSVSDIVLTYDAEEVCDIEENNVVFSIDNGSATVLDHVPGDVNGDDGLTSKDLLRLARYFAGWEVEVNENALDINGDGNVNSKDLLRLARYLAGWDVEIH